MGLGRSVLHGASLLLPVIGKRADALLRLLPTLN
jgi:hypothetical protein